MSENILTAQSNIPSASGGGHTIGWLTHDQLQGSLPDEMVQRFCEGAEDDDNWACYDYHDDYDMFFLCIPEELKDKESLPKLGAYISKNEVLVAYTHWPDNNSDYIPELIKSVVAKKSSPHRAMLAIVDWITKNDSVLLGKIEDRISSLEENTLESTNSELKISNNEISAVRRQLHPMYQMYQQLLDTLEDLMADENEVYSETDIKYCNRIHNRVERLYKTVINLRDYLSQVREAYQAQIDIGLNNIMKIFTVISAIFLPLTFIAGWYGMNFNTMPEILWKYGYVFVIALTVAIVLGCLVIFKRKKWF
jgi:magnesium transporter